MLWGQRHIGAGRPICHGPIQMGPIQMGAIQMGATRIGAIRVLCQLSYRVSPRRFVSVDNSVTIGSCARWPQLWRGHRWQLIPILLAPPALAGPAPAGSSRGSPESRRAAEVANTAAEVRGSLSVEEALLKDPTFYQGSSHEPDGARKAIEHEHAHDKHAAAKASALHEAEKAAEAELRAAIE